MFDRMITPFLFSVFKVVDDAYYSMRVCHLIIGIEKVDSVFMIIFKKINGHWNIIAVISC